MNRKNLVELITMLSSVALVYDLMMYNDISFLFDKTMELAILYTLVDKIIRLYAYIVRVYRMFLIPCTFTFLSKI